MTLPVSDTAIRNSKDTQQDDLRYTVVSIEKSEGPGGADGNNWYRYVIDSPGSPITGYRRGDKKEVVNYLQECTNKLQERLTTGKSPRAAGRKPKRPAAAK